MDKTSPRKGRTTPSGTIAIEFKGVKVKIPKEGLTLEALEEMIFDISRGIGQKAFVDALEVYDRQLAEERPRGMLKNLTKKTKYLETRIGEIKYRRTLYQEKGSGKLRYLLDEALKISKNQRMSLRVLEIYGTLAALEAYRKVAEQVGSLLGIKYSHEAIRQNVIREGQRITDQESKELEKIRNLDIPPAKEMHEVVYTETDATYIRRQRKGKRRGKKKRHFEVKIGIQYTGKEPRYQGGKKAARKLINKRVYAEIKAGRNKFLEQLSYLGERDYGLSMAKKSYFGGDGDGWIRAGQKEYFPTAEYLLCTYHLFERLRQALPGRGEEQKRIKVLFEKNKVPEALRRIQGLAQRSTQEKEKVLLLDYYGYVRNNINGIESSMRIRREDRERSAGAIEPAIDKTIAHRFKGRGMSWSERGASAILKIRQTIENCEWKDWWYEKRDKKIEIRGVLKPLLTAKALCKRQDIAPYVEMTLPCLADGQDQSKPWAYVLRGLTRGNLLKETLNPKG